MPVIRRKGGAGDRGAETGEHLGKLTAIEHAVLEPEIAGLLPHPLHLGVALLELGLAEAEMDAARPLVADRNPGALPELGGEARPFIRRAPGPALVMGRAVAFALDPDQPEIAARGAVGDIPLVEEGGAKPGAREPVADRRAD